MAAIAIVSSWYDRNYGDQHVRTIIEIFKVLTKDVGRIDEQKQKFSYFPFAHYFMSYKYYAPYEHKKSMIFDNISYNNNFVFLERFSNDDIIIIRYCYGVYQVEFLEVEKGSNIVISATYDRQSECYKKYKK